MQIEQKEGSANEKHTAYRHHISFALPLLYSRARHDLQFTQQLEIIHISRFHREIFQITHVFSKYHIKNYTGSFVYQKIMFSYNLYCLHLSHQTGFIRQRQVSIMHRLCYVYVCKLCCKKIAVNTVQRMSVTKKMKMEKNPSLKYIQPRLVESMCIVIKR